MGFKMMGGKTPKEKTGSGIPLNMKSISSNKKDVKTDKPVKYKK
jgi:hypothetical protein|tara:strand:- start:1818 stop:1949 length:132 start_codon:yes stop_codon:yes gene_type:complete